VFFVGMTGLTREPWWRESALAPPFQDAATWLGQTIPASVPNSVRAHLNPDAILDKIHPADVLKHLPNLSTLPQAPIFGAPAGSSTVSTTPAAATSARRVPPPSSTY
jgi:membrane protein required for colicin V production